MREPLGAFGLGAFCLACKSVVPTERSMQHVRRRRAGKGASQGLAEAVGRSRMSLHQVSSKKAGTCDQHSI